MASEVSKTFYHTFVIIPSQITIFHCFFASGTKFLKISMFVFALGL